jgi:hypothetical protein
MCIEKIGSRQCHTFAAFPRTHHVRPTLRKLGDAMVEVAAAALGTGEAVP